MRKLTENIRAVIAIMTITYTFVYFFLAAFFYPVHDAQITIAVIGINMIVYNFNFGSSQGSANKQQTIENNINKTT